MHRSVYLSFLFIGAHLFSGESVKVFSLEAYQGIAYADFPVFFEDKLYLVEKTDQTVRVYRINNGITEPEFLWKTPGNGQGPGEIPDSSHMAINGISIEPKNGDLWVSHRQGLLIFNPDGLLKKQVNRPFNQARFLHFSDQVIYTSKDVLKDRNLVTKVGSDLKTVHWKVAWPHEIPVTKQGAYLEPRPELFEFDSFFTHLILPGVPYYVLIQWDGSVFGQSSPSSEHPF